MRTVFRVVFVVLAALPVHAQIAVSANDTTEIMVDGVHVMVPNASPDTVTLIDLSARPPRVVAELNAPSSWSGPPQMVAVTPDESIALVASSLKANPADPAQTTQDNTDFRHRPQVVAARRHQDARGGPVPERHRHQRARHAGAGRQPRRQHRVDLHDLGNQRRSGRSDLVAGQELRTQHARLHSRWRHGLPDVHRHHRLAILSVNGTEVRDTGRSVVANLRPVGIEITPKGDLAIVANIGNGPTGGVDTLTVVDIASPNPRVVDSVAVGVIPEGLALSPRATTSR
jgi:hypothetical protein